MANGAKKSVFGGGSSSRSVPRPAKRVSTPRCACGATEAIHWMLTGVLEGQEGPRYIGEWKCAACRQGSLF